jgi:hypothetical protein
MMLIKLITKPFKHIMKPPPRPSLLRRARILHTSIAVAISLNTARHYDSIVRELQLIKKMVADDVGGWFGAGLDLLVRVCRDDVKFVSGERESSPSLEGSSIWVGLLVTQHQQTAIEWHTTIVFG